MLVCHNKQTKQKNKKTIRSSHWDNLSTVTKRTDTVISIDNMVLLCFCFCTWNWLGMDSIRPTPHIHQWINSIFHAHGNAECENGHCPLASKPLSSLNENMDENEILLYFAKSIWWPNFLFLNYFFFLVLSLLYNKYAYAMAWEYIYMHIYIYYCWTTDRYCGIYAENIVLEANRWKQR